MEDVREERRVVTACFADLVGSTALAERLDPEDIKLIVADLVVDPASPPPEPSVARSG